MKEISDDEIRVIGDSTDTPHTKVRHRWTILVAVAVVLAALLWFCHTTMPAPPDSAYFDSTTIEQPAVLGVDEMAALDTHDTLVGVTLRDTVVNDISLAIYQPHSLKPSLHVGDLVGPQRDTSIVMALQAADIRADNKEIVSAFVLRGEIISRGTAKPGFCAIIDGRVTLGLDEATPLYERAIEHEGDFFRQYPLVADGHIVESRIKNKALRRALAIIGGHLVVVTTHSRESLHDFSQALVDLGAETAVNLVGGKMCTGWITLTDSTVMPTMQAQEPLPPSVNYIIWTK